MPHNSSRRTFLQKAGFAGCSGLLFGGLSGALSRAWGMDAAGCTAPHKEGVITCDVCVIGAGGAGLAAAISAHEAGACVLVLEKMPLVGGNTLLADEAVSSLEDVKSAKSRVEAQEIRADRAKLLEEMLERGRTGRPELERLLVDRSDDTLEWLMAIGCDLPRREARWGYRHVWEYRPPSGEPLGSEVMRPLLYRVEQLGIPVITRTRAENITGGLDAGRLQVHAKDGFGRCACVDAGAVVIATGGFAGSLEAVNRLCPDAPARLMTTNTASATGDGLRLADGMGAAFCDLDAVVLQPTTEALSGVIVPMALRRSGAVLINREGRRFVNELAASEVVSNAILEQKDACAWLVADSTITLARRLQSDLLSPLAMRADPTILELARSIGVDEDALYYTFDACRRTRCTDGAAYPRSLPSVPFVDAPFYSIKVRPAYHSTPGGIRIDTQARALNRRGSPIPGLFAAGETAGGIWGRQRLDNLGLIDALVFGRIAGTSAAQEAKAHRAVELARKTGAAPQRG
ncbi:FAD-dependent oxidoreductase [uncultured Sutterella sp.]|uniref:FAD-dependent oxidoreductase n=1 Tax=uncultured Sutterella sp. TaxID=286133 RepID=UPI002600D0A3|nr:FAD-dependent oxidoreductase [uncultured Sutterella sp.]